MRLFPRLLLLGAALPSAAAAVILAGGVALTSQALRDELDHALLSQAAVEAVSLFDGPHGLHLHMSTSPLLNEVQQFAPRAAVYDAAGQRLLHYPEAEPLDAHLASLPSSTSLTTSDDGRARRVAVAVAQPHTGARHVLVLAADLDKVDATVGTLTRFAVASVVVLAVVLALLCWLWARRLSSRVGALQDHMQRLARGHLDDLPAVDVGDDEVRALRDAIAAATGELAAHRTTRERFIADAAHELRTPLASMQLALDLALRRTTRGAPNVDDLIAALQDARDETGRLTQLATGLLDVTSARTAPLRAEPVDIVAVVDAAVAGHRAAADRAGIAIAIADSSDVVVVGHAPSLRRAIDNLLDNALKYGRARVTIDVVAVDGVVRIGVDDDGPGIAAGDVEQVFAPFHHVGDERGVGLGLTLVREVARRHGGDAQATPGPGGHVTMTIAR